MTGHEEEKVQGLRRVGVVLVLAALFAGQSVFAAKPPRVGPVVFNTVTAAVSERIECRIGMDRSFENPYDPACVRLDAMIEGPSGRRVYPCFFRVPVTAAGIEAATGEWVFRHAFRMEGVYRIAFRLSGRAGTAVTPPYEIAVLGRRPGGFVRADPLHNGVWLRDDGTRFFASGLNVAWSEGADHTLYRDLLGRCTAAGIRFVRVWMVGFAQQELEWSEELWSPWNAEYGLGRYNQRVASFFDWLFEEAARQGVFVQLVLETHGEWSSVVDSNWEFNPYNAAHGGFLAAPVDFFTDPEARERTRARYRYCVARWGAEPALAAWELFNEADQTDAVKLLGEDAAVVAWHQDQARFIQKLDAVPRPVVSSASDPAFLLRLAVGAPVFDRLDLHLYQDDAVLVMDEALRTWRTTDGLATGLYCGEFGAANEQPSGDEDHARVRGLVRRMTWRARFAGLPAWYWFWQKAEAVGVFDVNRAVDRVFAAWDLSAIRPLAAQAVGVPPVERFTVTPEWGWAATTTQAHHAAFDGTTNQVLHGQSGFLQGAWKAEMGRRLILSADFLPDGVFEIPVTAISSAGANELTICVDGREIWRKAVTAGMGLQVRVGRGRHVLELSNTGLDWLRIGSVAVIQPAAQGAEAVAITDGRRVAVYIAGKQFLIGQDVAAEAFEGLTLRLDGWPGISGPSQVRFVDSADGADCGAVAVDGRDTGSLTLSLPPFTNDLVVIVD